MAQRYDIIELKPSVQRRVRKTHIRALRHYHRDLLQALFESELQQAGYSTLQLDFEPNILSLTKDGIKVTGADLEPSLLKRLISGGSEELTYQTSDQVIDEDMRAEHFLFFANGSLARHKCPSGSIRYYDGSLYPAGSTGFPLREYLELFCEIENISICPETIPSIEADLDMFLSRRGILPLKEIDLIITCVCLGWTDKTLQNPR